MERSNIVVAVLSTTTSQSHLVMACPPRDDEAGEVASAYGQLLFCYHKAAACFNKKLEIFHAL
jgi:hypothetical protein